MSRRPDMTASEIRETLRLLKRHAWADETDDEHRVVMWNSYDAIRQQRREIAALQERLVTQAVALERAEADNERLCDIAFGKQKGGAA